MAISGQAFSSLVDFAPIATAHEEKRTSAEALACLLHGDALALMISDYFSPVACEGIANRIIASDVFDPYLVEPKFFRGPGPSFYDTAKDFGLLDGYFANARRDMQELRQLCSPFGSPLDKLRAELDEVWPWGATVLTLSGRRMKAGIARVCSTREGVHGGVDPHVDSLGFDALSFPDAPRLKKQISANVCLKMSPEGGELELWNKLLVTPEDEAAYRLPTSLYALDRAKLGPPVQPRIRPRQGELYLFDTNRPHAVIPVGGGVRITLAVMIGYLGEGKPLLLWS